MEQSWQEWDDDHSDAFELAERDAMNGVRALLLPAEDARVIEIAEAFWSDYILRAGLMRSTEPDGTASAPLPLRTMERNSAFGSSS